MLFRSADSINSQEPQSTGIDQTEVIPPIVTEPPSIDSMQTAEDITNTQIPATDQITPMEEATSTIDLDNTNMEESTSITQPTIPETQPDLINPVQTPDINTPPIPPVTPM